MNVKELIEDICDKYDSGICGDGGCGETGMCCIHCEGIIDCEHICAEAKEIFVGGV